MSKERARRRAEREAAERARREREQRQARLLAPWTAVRTGLRRATGTVGAAGAVLPGAGRAAGGRPAKRDSALGRKRSRENGLLLMGLFVLNLVVWLVRPEWGWRVSALVLSLLLWPVLGVLVFDRRPSR